MLDNEIPAVSAPAPAATTSDDGALSQILGISLHILITVVQYS